MLILASFAQLLAGIGNGRQYRQESQAHGYTAANTAPHHFDLHYRAPKVL
jgi:hypothetical protein